MTDIRDSMKKAGLRESVTTVKSIYIDPDFRGGDAWSKFKLTELQRSWLAGHINNPVDVASPWSFISAPGMARIDVQSTIQNYDAFTASLGVNPFIMLDTETTGLNSTSSLFFPTEIGMASYSDFGRQTGLLNMTVAPTSKFGEYRNLLRKARSGGPLTREERYAAASFLRYADGVQIDANHQLVHHSPLFSPEIAEGFQKFTPAQIKGMRKGLFNLMRQGLPEHQVTKNVEDFFENHGLKAQKFFLSGHNLGFDMQSMNSVVGKETWQGLLGGLAGTVDTNSIVRMVHGDPTALYKRYLFDKAAKQYGPNNPLTMHQRRTIYKDVERQLRELDFDRAGMLTMDSLKKLTGASLNDAHSAAIDAIQQEVVFRNLHPTLQQMLHQGLVDARNGYGLKSTRPGVINRLRYSTSPMQIGDHYISMAGIQSTGLDFAITDEGDVLSKWVGNSKAIYQYQGLFQHDNVYGAKFYSPSLKMTAYLTGSAPEEVRKKIQGGVLQYIRPEDIDSLPEEVLNDLARQQMNKWTNLHGGFETMQKFVDYHHGRGELKSWVDRRTYKTIETRLGSEIGALDTFIETVKDSKLSSTQKSLAFRMFYQELGKEAPLPLETIDRSWDPTVPILGGSASLRDPERFVNSVIGSIDKTIQPNASARAKSRSREVKFNQILKDLVEEGYISPHQAEEIGEMKNPKLRNQIEQLNSAIQETHHAEVQAARTPVESMKARLIQLDRERAAELASASVKRAVEQTVGIFESADFGGALSALNPNYRKMLDAIVDIRKAYTDQGFGVQFADIGGHLKMYLSTDKSGFDSVSNTIANGGVPLNTLSVEIPSLSNTGHIAYGGELRINPQGKLIPRAGHTAILRDTYNDLTGTIAYQAENVHKIMFPGEGKVADVDRARRSIAGSIRDVFEKASGVSRSTTFQAFEEANRLDVRGNFADILRTNQVNVQEMMHELTGRHWENARIDDITDFLATFQEKAREHYKHNPLALSLIEKMTGEGVKEEKFREGFFSLASERDYTAFGIMSGASRPNLAQWLNFYGYQSDEIQKKLDLRFRRYGRLEGVSLNPYIVSRAEAEAYRTLSQGGKGYAPGVSVSALQLSSSEFMDVLNSSQGQEVLNNYGLTLEDVAGQGTWEQGVIASPEMRGMLEGRQPKIFEVNMDSLEKGSVRLNKEIRAWMDSGAKTPLRLKKGQMIFDEMVPLAGGRTRSVATDFEDDIGRLLSAEEISSPEGERLLRLNAEAVFPMTNSSKVMFDTRKGTLSYFGGQAKSVKASRAMHELFGEDTHLIYLGNVAKHKDVAADVKGQVANLVRLYQNDKDTLNKIARQVSDDFGPTRLIQLPGHNDWTLEIPNATIMGKNPKITPEYVENKINALMKQFPKGEFVMTLPGGKEAVKSTVELRRMNVNETYRTANYLGEGLNTGAGLKIGPREIRSLRAKGMILGTNMEPLIQHLMSEGELMPGRASYRTAAQDMVKAIGYFVNPDTMSQLLSKNTMDLEPFTKFKNQKWYLAEQLTEGTEGKGTIVGQKRMFALELPVPVEISVGKGSQSVRRLTQLPIARQMLKPDDKGRIFLNNQSRSLVGLFDAIESYNSFNVIDIPHGEYETRELAERAIGRYTRQYLDNLGEDISSSSGQLMEHAVKYRVSSSARLRAQNISANLSLDDNLSGRVMISPDLMNEMFGEMDSESAVYKALHSDEGFYGLLMRDPNESAWNFAVMNYRVDPKMRGRSARMAATEAAMMGADFDGDQVGMLSPYTKRMEDLLTEDPEAFSRLQMQLGSIHRKQTQYNKVLASNIEERYLGEKASQSPLKFAEYFEEASTNRDIAGDLYFRRVMGAHLSKTAAGQLYNVAQRYGDVGQAIFQAIGDPTERAQKMELLNMFTEVTTERMSLKGKAGGNPLSPKEVNILRGELLRGENLASKWRRQYANAMSDNTAISWSGARGMLTGAGVSSWAEASPELQRSIKLTLADRMLRNVEDIQNSAMQSGFGTYFTADSEASRVFFSEQAYNKNRKNLIGLYDQYLNIQSENEETFMRHFVPTEFMAGYAEASGQTDQYLIAKQKFYERLQIADTAKVAPIIAADDVIEAAAKVESSTIKVETTVADVAEETNLWKKVPTWMKAAGLIAGGLAVVGAASRREPRPEKVPEEREYEGPSARVAMNNEVESQMNGQRINIRARNERGVQLDNIAEGLKQHVDSGNVNIYQKDDTRTMSHEWAQEMFTNAVRRGRASAGTSPNTY